MTHSTKKRDQKFVLQKDQQILSLKDRKNKIQREKTHITNNRNERGEITIALTEIKRIKR